MNNIANEITSDMSKEYSKLDELIKNEFNYTNDKDENKNYLIDYENIKLKCINEPGLIKFYDHQTTFFGIDRLNNSFEKNYLLIDNNDYKEVELNLIKRLKSIRRYNIDLEKRILNYLLEFRNKKTLINKDWKKIKHLPLNKNEFINKYGKKCINKIKPKPWSSNVYAGDFYIINNKENNEFNNYDDYNNKLYNSYLNLDIDSIQSINKKLYNDLMYDLNGNEVKNSQ